MASIICLGELLIDLTQSGSDENGNGVFTAFPGGAPANVAVAAARLGADTAFIGKVGDDAFGKSLAGVLEKEGVDTAGLYFDEDEPTTLAIASIDKTGERSFSFYRSPGADTCLTEEEALSAMEEAAGGTNSVLHVGSLSLTTSPSREACMAAVRYAYEKGMLVSYDPNYREALWDSEEEAVKMMKSLLRYTDILKVSEEEMEMLTGTADTVDGSLKLMDMINGDLVMVTLGADGVFVRRGQETSKVPGVKVKVADTNGAGDTFLGAMLMQLTDSLEQGGDPVSEMEWIELLEMIVLANRAASITCSRSGAIPAMPTADEMR